MTRRITPECTTLYFWRFSPRWLHYCCGKILSPLLGADNPYLTAWAAIVLSAWYYGVGPSVVCTLISVLGSLVLVSSILTFIRAPESQD